MKAPWWLVLIFSLALISAATVLPLQHGFAQTLRDAPAASLVDSPSDDLSSAERLTLRFRGYSDLSGDYRINGDGTISVPVLGRIPVSQISAAEFEKVLAEKVASVTGKESHVTVEVARYRPVYVTGYVKSSGAVEWRPRLNVLQALALAGGIYMSGSSDLTSLNGDGEARDRKVADDWKRAIAKLARLSAERKGLAQINVPPRLIEAVGSQEAERLIESQSAILMSRRTALENQMATLNRGQALARQELEALQVQDRNLQEQLEQRRQQVQRTRELIAKGFAPNTRLYDEEARVSDLEEKRIIVSVSVARIQGVIAGLERDAGSLRLERRASIEVEIATLERDVAQLEIDSKAANTSLTTTSVVTSNRRRDANPFVYEIIRPNNTGSASIIAEPLTLVLPGDVVAINRRPIGDPS
jgi:protein involved in polysaccharide export with SLBB domain